MKRPRETKVEEERRGERERERCSDSLVTLLSRRAIPRFPLWFSLAGSPLPLTRPRRVILSRTNPVLGLVCALITLLEPPPSLATLEINGSLPIVTTIHMGWGAVGLSRLRANKRARSFLPSQPLVIPEHRFFVRSFREGRERHRRVRVLDLFRWPRMRGA